MVTGIGDRFWLPRSLGVEGMIEGCFGLLIVLIRSELLLRGISKRQIPSECSPGRVMGFLANDYVYF